MIWRDMIWYIFNRNWVDNRWRQYSTQLHTNNTQNTEYTERNINSSADFRKILKYQILRRSIQGEPKCSMRTDEQTDMTQLIVTFSNIVKAPKTEVTNINFLNNYINQRLSLGMLDRTRAVSLRGRHLMHQEFTFRQQGGMYIIEMTRDVTYVHKFHIPKCNTSSDAVLVNIHFMWLNYYFLIFKFTLVYKKQYAITYFTK
jgi:hypothetical protein